MQVIRLSRRRLLPALFLLLAAVTAVLFFTLKKQDSPGSFHANGSTGCVAYLDKLGWQVDPEPIETLHLQLPEDLSGDSSGYLTMHKEPGPPLADLDGQTSCRYTSCPTN